uniref:DNA-binding protein inhibitor ID-4 n=1 Tax=Laticauda laticaudata TaxID=8630 RepID=A0A8C5S914_LATLA
PCARLSRSLVLLLSLPLDSGSVRAPPNLYPVLSPSLSIYIDPAGRGRGGRERSESWGRETDQTDKLIGRLRKLVPTIPPNKRVSKVEILQHVIDYILDLQLALETHPALLRPSSPPPPPPPLHPASYPGGTPRTPLTTLNADPAGAVKKQGDSILCR